MKSRSIIGALTLLAVGVPFIIGQDTVRSTSVRNGTCGLTKPRRTNLDKLLVDIGFKYDVYFTIEDAKEHREFPQDRALQSYYTFRQCPQTGDCDSSLSEIHDLDKELEAIQKELPSLGYVRDPENPNIIHVYDIRLKKATIYPMNRNVGPIRFTGNLGGLLDSLYKDGAKVSLTYPHIDSPNGQTMAELVPVQVNIPAATVRDVIANAWKLDSNKRILWISYADADSPSFVTVHLATDWNVTKRNILCK